MKTVALDTDLGPVGQGGSGARYVTSPDGARWVMKATFLGGQAHRYLYLNEALSAQVAGQMGVTTPEVAIMDLSHDQLATFSSTSPASARQVIASRLVDPAEALSPELVREVPTSERAAVTVLDAVVWNTDRNPEHLLATSSETAGWHLVAIDHGHTFATADTIVGGLDPAAPMPAHQSLLHDGLTQADVVPWIDRAAAIPRKDFYEMVRDLPPAWVVEPDAPDALADALVARIREVARSLPSRFASP